MKRIQIRIRIRITDFASCVEKKVDSDSNKRIRIQTNGFFGLSKCSLSSAFGLSNVCTPGGPAATGTEVW